MSELECFIGEIEERKRKKYLDCLLQGVWSSLLSVNFLPTVGRKGTVSRYLTEADDSNTYLGGYVLGSSCQGLIHAYLVAGEGLYFSSALAATTNALSGIYEVARYIHKRYAPTSVVK